VSSCRLPYTASKRRVMESNICQLLDMLVDVDTPGQLFIERLSFSVSCTMAIMLLCFYDIMWVLSSAW
jgi:hypothetical protein